MKKITVLGSGSFGTALATVIAKKSKVTLWCFEAEVAETIVATRMNTRYLPGVVLNENIQPTFSLYEAVKESYYIVLAIPLRHIRSTLEILSPSDIVSKHWVIASKGIEQKTELLPGEILNELAGEELNYSVLSGPTFARELGHELPSVAMLAAKTHELWREVNSLFSTHYFSLRYSADIRGTQLCGALKNVLALLIGIAKGEKCNTNIIAFLFSEGIKELALLLEMWDGDKNSAYGLAGIGDAILTSFGELGRNQKAGILLGQGLSLAETIATLGHEPEGINTLHALNEIIQHKKIQLPLFNGIYDIVFNQKGIQSVIKSLLHNSEL